MLKYVNFTQKCDQNVLLTTICECMYSILSMAFIIYGWLRINFKQRHLFSPVVTCSPQRSEVVVFVKINKKNFQNDYQKKEKDIQKHSNKKCLNKNETLVFRRQVNRNLQQSTAAFQMRQP